MNGRRKQSYYYATHAHNAPCPPWHVEPASQCPAAAGMCMSCTRSPPAKSISSVAPAAKRPGLAQASPPHPLTTSPPLRYTCRSRKLTSYVRYRI